MLRCALCWTVFVGMVVGPAFAQKIQPRPDTTLLAVQEAETEESKLGIYTPKYLPAKEAADLIERLIGGNVSAIPEPLGNRVLIRASEKELKEARAVLEMLDQPPKMIAFDVTFADLPALAGDAKPAEHGTSDEAWLDRLKDDKEKAKGNISELRLTATENQKAMVQFGEEAAVVTGMQAFGGGRERPGRTAVTQQRQFGTLMQCTARVLDDGTIVAEFQIERSKIAPPEDATLLEESDDAGALRAPGMLTTTCTTTLKLKPGQPRVISGLKSQGKSKGTHSVIVITAELIAAE